MTRTWMHAIALLRDSAEPYVLITVIGVQGSTPRESGSKMLVTAGETFDTIGGGHLEFAAIERARQLLLAGKDQQALEHFPLGARLGQCCGGRASLLFECFAARGPQVLLFGAGHVGRALVPLLASLPCKVRWIDSREAEFPDSIPEGVTRVISEDVIDEIDEMPAGSYFIVMTHNHALDLELTAKILARNDFAYFGLIGSDTKRAKFEHRLRDRGFAADTVQRMRCPMGISEVKGKLPVEIAVSIAGEVIATYNATFGQQASQGENTVARLLPTSRRARTADGGT